MNLMKRWHISWWTLGICFAALLVLWPLLKEGFFVSDDGEWMVIRLSAFFQSLREGQFPVRFLGRLNHSYGYPVANFLYPGFLYIGSLLHLAGFSFVGSVKIIFIGSVIGGAWFLFLWLRKFFSINSSFWGTLGFLFSPYLLFDIYKRGSVGEILATFAIFAILWSVEQGIQWAVPIVTALLIVSHNSLALIFFLFLVFYLFVRNKYESFIPVLIGIGLSTFFWFPAILEQKFVLFNTLRIANSKEYFIDQSMLFLVGLVNAIAFILVLKDKEKGMLRSLFLWMFFVSIVFATSLSLHIWNLSFMNKLFQFPYRFLSLGFIAGPWLIAQVLKKISKKYYWRCVWLFILLWIIPAYMMLSKIEFVSRPEGYYTTNEATTTVTNEYMPRWVKETPRDRAHQRLVFYQGRGTIKDTIMSTQKIDALIFADEQSILQINSIYYPGWGIAIDDQFVAPDYQNVYGLMRIAVSPGKHSIKAEFRETIQRFLADAASVIFGFFYIAYIVWMVKKKKVK